MILMKLFTVILSPFVSAESPLEMFYNLDNRLLRKKWGRFDH